MAKTSTVKGTIENAYGQPLTSAVKYEGTFEELENVNEIPADEKLSDEDVLAVVNGKRKAAARQKYMNAALTAAGIQKPTLEDPKVQFDSMVKILKANGKNDEQARVAANAVLGTSF